MAASLPLFETQIAKHRAVYRAFTVSVFAGICAIWTYRLKYVPAYGEDGRWPWLGMFMAELWFGFYWILTQANRWNPVYRKTFKDRLSKRFESGLPAVDVFVCTADAAIEPPIMVINTVLSVMAYDYPPEKLSVYLSDDGCSDLTFYALLEASQFAKYWLPYCRKFKVEPRSPAAYFRTTADSSTADFREIKRLFEEMEHRIRTVTKLGRVPEEIQVKHTAFSEWSSFPSKRDHNTILKILINGTLSTAEDVDGCKLPTLVYLAREKRPEHHHNYKAGALNALLRVSAGVSNGQIILTVDCDMYSNNSESVRDSLCFFMDEEKGHEVAYVQFPQKFENITENDLYGGSLRIHSQVEFQGLDSFGGPMYIGTGCFHRRESLCGLQYTKGYRNDWTENIDAPNRLKDTAELEQKLGFLASCAYELNTQWGKEMGMKYGCATEDVITGLTIQCRGWKSVFYNPSRMGFLGIAPTTLAQTLVQQMRWSGGNLQNFLSKHGLLFHASGKISLGLQMGYSVYLLWAPNCFATICYSLVPALNLLKGTALFPNVSSVWFLPFAYVTFAQTAYNFGEFRWAGSTAKGWWNEQRIGLYKRQSSYLLAMVDTFLWLVGSTGSAFFITAKVSDQDVTQRYHQELIEFGASNQMFTILTTLALINLFCFGKAVPLEGMKLHKMLDLQFLLCGVLVLINLPLYNGLFLRRDSGRMPTSVTVRSVAIAIVICILYTFT